jgi:hypothetical protein
MSFTNEPIERDTTVVLPVAEDDEQEQAARLALQNARSLRLAAMAIRPANGCGAIF